MPQREQLLEDITGENRHAALLVTQVGGMPTELQLIVQIAEYDEAAQGLRPLRTYIIRVNGVIEHRVVNLGMTTDDVRFVTDHPILYQYNQRPQAVFFRGDVTGADALALDIAQAHATTFGPWRHFPEYLNTAQPLATLLMSGGGLLGQMPAPLAENVIKVLARHGLEHHAIEDKAYIENAEGPMRNQPVTALIIGDSYFLSHMFTVEVMRGRTPRAD